MKSILNSGVVAHLNWLGDRPNLESQLSRAIRANIASVPPVQSGRRIWETTHVLSVATNIFANPHLEPEALEGACR